MTGRPVLYLRGLHERRRWLVGWSLGIVALAVISIVFWPSIEGQADDMNEMIDQLPESLKSLFGMGGGIDPFSSIGYLSSQVYAFMLPMLLLIAGIGVAASLAGEEERGLLETTFVLPLRRRRLVAERWLLLIVLTSALSAVTFVAVLVTVRLVDLEVGTWALVWASVSAAVLTWSIAGVGLVAGAFTGRRSVAITAAATLAVASYVITSLADAGIGFFEWLEPVSLFSHYDVVHTLLNGRPPWSMLILLAVAAVCAVASMWAIERRDLRAG